jgi:hypothetical protein
MRYERSISDVYEGKERDRERQRESVYVCVCVCGCGGRKARFLTDCDRRTDGILIGRG